VTSPVVPPVIIRRASTDEPLDLGDFASPSEDEWGVLEPDAADVLSSDVDEFAVADDDDEEWNAEVEPGSGGEDDGAWVEGAEPELVGFFNSKLVLRGLLNALANACREGIPAERLRGYATVRSVEGTTVLKASADFRMLLEAELADHTRRVDRAMDLVLSTDDAKQRADYRKKEDLARAAAGRVERKLADLDVEEVEPLRPTTFATYSDMVQAALTNTALSSNRVSQEQFQALRMVMPRFEMRRDDLGQWTASAVLRLNLAEGGIAEFGPVHWPVGTGGRGSGIRQSRSAAHSGRESRKVVHARLLATGRVSQARCLLLMNASFPELAYVVLHETVAHPYPDWVGEEWRAAPFARWVTAWYTDPDAWWRMTASYVSFSHERQLLAYLAADRGPLTVAELRKLVRGFDNGRLRLLSDTGLTTKRPWYRSVLLNPPGVDSSAGGAAPATGSRRPKWRGTGIVTSVICDCGQPARVVARVPEVPRCLLCECGRMPEAARFGMDRAVRFPEAYRRVLMLSKAECVAEVDRMFGVSVRPQTERATQILEQVDLLRRGATTDEVASQIHSTRRNVHEVLMRLHRQGFLGRTDGSPRLWVLPSGQA